MLPLLYPDPQTRDALLEDPQAAPIPALHREMFGFAERFVCRSAESTAGDLDRLRRAGLTESDLVHWATLGSTQSWFTMSADGGGVPLEGDAPTGGVGRSREDYEARSAGLLAPVAANAAYAAKPAEGIAWVGVDESSDGFRETAAWAEARYGFVPKLLRAVSLRPEFYPRHRLALELLERPQSERLSARQHAMVRTLVSHATGSTYGLRTARALLARVGEPASTEAMLSERPSGAGWDPVDRAVLGLADKLVRSAYKVTEKDAIALREVGLDDEAYVDILNTVAIQTSLDRLANVLGVAPDPEPILPA